MSQHTLTCLLSITFFLCTAAWVPFIDRIARSVQANDTWRPLPEDRPQRTRSRAYMTVTLLIIATAITTTLLG